MVKTHFIWDELSDNVLMETDELGAVQAEYTQEPELYGSVLSQKRGSDTSYYHFDGQGSTRQLTDDSENVTDTATYTAFGEEVAKTGATENPWGYKGALGYYATTEGDVYARARNLGTHIARWFSVDPRGHFEGVNLFAFCLNSPGACRDPSGEAIEVETLEATKSGDYSCAQSLGKAYYQFFIKPPVSCHGWLIQKVYVNCKISICEENGPCCKKKRGDGGGIDESGYYYEAWRIPPGRRTSGESGKTSVTGFKYSDVALYDKGKSGLLGEHGFYEQKTELKFFCEESVKKLGTKGIGDLTKEGRGGLFEKWERDVLHVFGPGKCSSTSSGSLYSGNADKFFNDAQYIVYENKVGRLFSLEWHCCPKCPNSLLQKGVTISVLPPTATPKR